MQAYANANTVVQTLYHALPAINYSYSPLSLKGLVHPKVKILSLITPPHVVPDS